MRPKVLEFSAFGSYPNKESIDFEKINDLFLITGNTGAGKTTILDALTYALYGDTSGGDRPADSIRCEKASDRVTTAVKLTFEHDGHLYSVDRSFEPQFKSDSAKYKACLKRDDVTIASKRTDVTKEIIKLIKLDLDKWRMIVTIPQGKFSDLIKADSGEQKEIIKNIFNTGQYGEYTEEIGKRRETASANVRECTGRIRSELPNIECDAGSELQTKVSECASAKDSVIIDKIKDVIVSLSLQNQTDEDNISGSEESLTELKKEYQTADKALKDAKDLLARYQKLDSLNTEFGALDSQKESYDQQKNNNDRSKSALYNVKPKEDLLNKDIALLYDIEESIKAKTAKISELKTSFEESDKDLEIAKRNKADNAEEEVKYTVVKSQLEDYEDLSKKTSRRSEIDVSLKDVQSKAESLNNDVTILKDEKKEIESFISSNDISEELNSVKLNVERSNDLVKAVKKVKKDLLELKTSEDDLIKKDEILRSSLQKSKFAKEECDRIEALYFGNYEALIAERLVDGTACPVCGSLDHPHPAEFKGESATEEEWNDAKAERDAKETAANENKHQCEAVKEKIRTSKEFIINELKEIEIEFEIANDYIAEFDKIADEKNADNRKLKSKLKELQKIEEELLSKKERLKIVNGKIEELQNQLSDLNSQQGEFNVELSNISGAIDSLSNKLEYSSKEEAEKNLAAMKEHIDSIDKALKESKDRHDSVEQELRTTESSLKEEIGRRSTASDDVSSARDNFNRILKENEFSSEEEYRTFLKEDEEIKEIDEKIGKFFVELNRKEALVKDQMKEIGDAERPSNIEELEAAAKVAEKRKDDALTTFQKVKDRIARNRSIERRLTESMDEHSVLTKRLDRLQDLWSAASGKSISFDVFVQEKYFRTIVAEANRIFVEMSQRRYRMITKSDTQDAEKKDILNLNVEDLEEETIRDIRSLSGGETFLAALSLALGFSTTIQELAGGNTVDALFIDEGFGTLDDDHLSSTAKMLLSYASGNGELNKRKCIGLITHRKELETYISKKLNVVYDQDNGSRIEKYL